MAPHDRLRVVLRYPGVSNLHHAFRGQRVLVTGGASFIGSHLTELLLEAGALVTVADDFSSGSIANLAAVEGAYRLVRGDLRDSAIAEEACRGQSRVFHLAAAHGGRGYIDTHPVECLNNMVLDHTVFRAAALAGATQVVYASSACVYPTVLQADLSKPRLLSEEDANFAEPGRAFADGAYGWAKLMGELQLAAFHRQFGIDVVSCRLFTVYGPRENESHAVIALIAKALTRMDPYPIWGDGTQTRNFTFVKDTVTGMALASAKLTGCEVVNVGSDTFTSVDTLIAQIFNLVGWTPRAVLRQPDMPVGVLSRAASVEKMRRVTGWEPVTDLEQGLAETMGWCQEHLSRGRLERLEDHLMSR